MVTLTAAFTAITTFVGTAVTAAIAFYATYQIVIRGGWFVCKAIYRVVKRRHNRD